MKKQAVHVVSATTEPRMTVAVELSDGRTVRVALADLAERLAVFAPLAEPAHHG